jgi:hypothetical protein
MIKIIMMAGFLELEMRENGVEWLVSKFTSISKESFEDFSPDYFNSAIICILLLGKCVNL